MVVNTFNSSTYEAETDRSFEFKTSLICIYITSSRTSKAERDRDREIQREGGKEGYWLDWRSLVSFLSQIEFFFLLAKGEISSENHLISNTVKNLKMDCKIDLKGIFQDPKLWIRKVNASLYCCNEEVQHRDWLHTPTIHRAAWLLTSVSSLERVQFFMILFSCVPWFSAEDVLCSLRIYMCNTQLFDSSRELIEPMKG